MDAEQREQAAEGLRMKFPKGFATVEESQKEHAEYLVEEGNAYKMYDISTVEEMLNVLMLHSYREVESADELYWSRNAGELMQSLITLSGNWLP